MHKSNNRENTARFSLFSRREIASLFHIQHDYPKGTSGAPHVNYQLCAPFSFSSSVFFFHERTCDIYLSQRPLPEGTPNLSEAGLKSREGNDAVLSNRIGNDVW